DFHVTGVQTCALPIWLALTGLPVETLRDRSDPAPSSAESPRTVGRWWHRRADHATVRVELVVIALRHPGLVGGGDPCRNQQRQQIGRASCRGRGWIAG